MVKSEEKKYVALRFHVTLRRGCGSRLTICEWGDFNAALCQCRHVQIKSAAYKHAVSGSAKDDIVT